MVKIQISLHIITRTCVKSSANYRLTFLGYLINFRRNSRRRVIEIFSMLADWEKGWTLYLLSLCLKGYFQLQNTNPIQLLMGKCLTVVIVMMAHQ